MKAFIPSGMVTLNTLRRERQSSWDRQGRTEVRNLRLNQKLSWPFWTHQIGRTSLSCWLHEICCENPQMHLSALLAHKVLQKWGAKDAFWVNNPDRQSCQEDAGTFEVAGKHKHMPSRWWERIEARLRKLHSYQVHCQGKNEAIRDLKGRQKKRSVVFCCQS